MATFTNIATLTYGDNTTTSNIVTGELLEVLSGTKSAVSQSYSSNEDITYVLTLRNSGTTALTGITVTDDLGAYEYNTQTVYPLQYNENTLLYYIDGVLQPTPTVTAGPPLTITGINIPGGSNATIIYEAEVTNYAPLIAAAEITNTATVTGGGIATPVTLAASVPVTSEASLTISKAICPTTVTENGQLTYTFIIENSGITPTIATDAAVLTDTFNPILDPITVTFNGTTWTEGTEYTYDTTTGEFATLPGQITVDAATFTQNQDGTWVINPGVSTLVITGTV